MLTYLIIGILVVIALYLVSTYNFFATAKTRVNASKEEIANQLKRQAELIPNLESSVKGYLKHEKGILEMLAEARKSADKGKDTSKTLNEVLPKLQILVESNPELKGNTVVQNLMDDLRDTSDKVMYSRRLFIDLTADYNVRRVTFPTNLIAGILGFPELKGFDKDIDSDELQTPKISL